MHPDENFRRCFSKFVVAIEKVVAAECTDVVEVYSDIDTCTFRRKYIRVYTSLHRVKPFCFVEIDTGNIFRSESVVRPRKVARGSIFSSKFGAESISSDGPKKLPNGWARLHQLRIEYERSLKYTTNKIKEERANK